MKRTDINLILLVLITILNVISLFEDPGIYLNISIVILCLLLIFRIMKGEK